jgi:hypothetical protein
MTVMREKIQRPAIVPPVRDPEASVQHPWEAGRAEPKTPNHRMLMIGLMGMTLYRNKMQWAISVSKPCLVLCMHWCLLFVLVRHGEEGATSLHALPFFFEEKFPPKGGGGTIWDGEFCCPNSSHEGNH